MVSLNNVPFVSGIAEHRWVVSMREKAQVPEMQRRLVLIVVCVALLLDNMLYMVIVPIIPVYLTEHSSPEKTIYSEHKTYYILATGDGEREILSDNEVQERNLSHSPFVTKVKSTLLGDLFGWTAHAHMKGADFADDVESTNRPHIGLLFASKAIVQLFISPFAGPIIDRMGYERPMLVGLTVLFFSTAIFAVGTSEGVLFAARSLQGVGSAFADTAGLAMIADRFKEPGERSKAQGIALAFISFGSLFAPPFGGFLYEFAGKSVPFVVLSLVALIDGSMLLLIMRQRGSGGDGQLTPDDKFATEKKSEVRLHGTPIYRLIMDPYIAICAGALVVANVNLAFLEPTIATWMSREMKAEEWQIGAVWLPAFFPHVLGVVVTVKLMRAFPNKQWLITAVGLVLEGASCLFIPFCPNFVVVILPLMVDCFGIALVDTAILPTLAYLVDVRHVSVYGSVYAIADVSYSLAYAFGPVIADWIYTHTTFTTLNIVIFLASAIYAPILFLLRNIYQYGNFVNDEEDDMGGGGTSRGTVSTPALQTTGCTSTEAKPINAGPGVGGADYRSYMMSTLPSSDNGSATNYHQQPPQIQQPEHHYTPVSSDAPAAGQPCHDDVNRKYVQVGRARSRDSTDDNGDYRSYR